MSLEGFRGWLFAVLFVLSAPSPASSGQWEPALQTLRSGVAGHRNTLEALAPSLRARVRLEAPARLEEVSTVPPPARRGWGLLPQWVEVEPGGLSNLQQTVYTFGWIRQRLDEEGARVARLNARIESGDPVDALIDEFSGRVADLGNLQAHVDYHEQWQRSVVRYPLYFQTRNALLPKVESLSRLEEAGRNPARQRQLRDEILAQLETFRPSPGLQLVREDDGWVLPVALCTDIEDTVFLEEAQHIIEDTFTVNRGGDAARFEVRLQWRVIPMAELYAGDTAPTPGERIDLDRHLKRFAGCDRVLTTGAASTYARAGAHVVLGNGPTDPGVLAHEFGHLLGFEDAYLRAWRGDLESPDGVTLIEWWGLSDDLMGDSRHGTVTDSMVEQLVSAYAPKQH